MRLNLDLVTSGKKEYSNSPLIPSMSRDIAVSPPEITEPQSKFDRQLAWQIAPNLFLSFKYAWAGVLYAFVTQRNFRIHTIIGSLAISLGIFLRIPAVQLAIITLTIALVMVLELLNTALESVVDLTVKQAYHELAKIAKDCAAGAVLIAALAAVSVASLILFPPIFNLILAS